MNTERYDFRGVKPGGNAIAMLFKASTGDRGDRGGCEGKQLLIKNGMGFVDENCGCPTRVHKRSVWTPNSELFTSTRQSPKNTFLPKQHLLSFNPFRGSCRFVRFREFIFHLYNPTKASESPPTSHNGTDSSPHRDNPRAPKAPFQLHGRQRGRYPIRSIQRHKNSKLGHRTAPAPQVDAWGAPSAKAASEEPRA